MLSKPHKVVAAAWKDYCERGTDGKAWRWFVKEIRERYGYPKDALYKDFDACGWTQRREKNTRKKPPPTVPPCPALGLYCMFCGLLPKCTDWHCNSCDLTKTCACQLPKSQEWLGSWWAWGLERSQKGETLGQYTAESEVPWQRSGNNTCKACGCPIANESTLCRTCRPKVRGLCARESISEEEAIKWLKEGYVD